MKYLFIILIYLLPWSALLAMPTLDDNRRFLPDKIVIKTADDQKITQFDALQGKLRNSATKPAVTPVFGQDKISRRDLAAELGLLNIYLLQLKPGTQILQLCQTLQSEAQVLWAEPVYILEQHTIPNDSLYGVQAHLPQIAMPSAWSVVIGDSAVPIAIIDTGVDWTHPDLCQHIWINPGEDINNDGHITAVDSNDIDDDGNGYPDDFRGWDWVTGMSGSADNQAASFEDGEIADNDPMDVNGHGTHVAGLAAASTNNEIGVASVSWGCQIMPLRIGYHSNDGNGLGLSTWMADAFIYATDMGAKIANLSFGNSYIVLDAARYAFLNDVAIATSAGNSNILISEPLSLEPWSLTITAVDQNDLKTWYSNYGPEASLAAPGGNVDPGLWSTVPRNQIHSSYYEPLSGTSMASPVVAGLLGLIRSQHPEWSVYQTYYQIAGSADNIDPLNPNYAGQLGYGRVNGYRAVTETVTPTPDISFQYAEYDDVNGNNNGLPDPGETVDLIIHLDNRWAGDHQVTGQLSSADPHITIINGSVVLDTLYGLEQYPNDNSNSTPPFRIALAANILPGKIPLTLHLQSETFEDDCEFDLPVRPQVLVVDDHLGGGDGTDVPIADYFFQVLDSLGIAYAYWLNESTPDSGFIRQFPLLYWDCEWAFPSLNQADRSVISHYLEGPGKLFLAGQDIGWDLCGTDQNAGNQYDQSGGASLLWYENTLGCRFVSDDAGQHEIDGVTSLSLTQGLNSAIQQPQRDASQQFPSVVSPLENSVSIFNYPDGTSAAILKGDSSVIYFAFGGYEAISDPAVRGAVMRRITDFFTGIRALYPALPDVEYTGPYPVTAAVHASAVIDTVQLWYQIDDHDWQFETMSTTDNLNYTAQIPAITTQTAVIRYKVFALDATGRYAAHPTYQFYVGPDTIKPTITPLTLPVNTVDQLGPYPVIIQAEDNNAIDTTRGMLYFKQSQTSWDSVALEYKGDYTFEQTIRFDTPVSDGDSIFYYLKVYDRAETSNCRRYPENSTLYFRIIRSMTLDDFEQDLDRWQVEAPWVRHSSGYVIEGEWCLKTAPASYQPNLCGSVGYYQTFNLSSRWAAQLEFLRSHQLDSRGDTCFLELRDGNGNWIVTQFYSDTSALLSYWQRERVSLNEWVGEDRDSVAIRFRFVSDSVSNEKPGVYIDAMQLLVDHAVNDLHPETALNTQFSLGHGYPNPFNAQVVLPIYLPQPGQIKIRVYDILGRTVFRKTLYAKTRHYDFKWQPVHRGVALAAGVYLVQVNWQTHQKTRKVLYLK